MVAYKEQRDSGKSDRNANVDELIQPHRVLTEKLIGHVEAVNHCQANPCECHRDRQNNGISIRGKDVHAHFSNNGQNNEDDNMLAEVTGNLACAVNGGQRIPAHAQCDSNEHEKHFNDAARTRWCNTNRCHEHPLTGGYQSQREESCPIEALYPIAELRLTGG